MLVRNTLALVAVLALSTSVFASPAQNEVKFLRGDCQVDGAFNMTDVIVIFLVVTEGRRVPCMQACDANDDGIVSTADVLAVMDVFVNRNPLPNPFPQCGLEDELGAEEAEIKEEQEAELRGNARPLTCRRHDACL